MATLNTYGHIMSHADESAAAKLDGLLATEREADDPICIEVANAVMGRLVALP